MLLFGLKFSILSQYLLLWHACFAIVDAVETTRSCSSDALVQPLQALNSTHSFTLVQGTGRYKGKHRIVLGYAQNEWHAHVTTRLTHVLVDGARANKITLPHELANKLEDGQEKILGFISAALRSDWTTVEKALDRNDLHAVIGIWLANPDADLFSKLSAVNGNPSSTHVKVFRVLTRAIEGCYPGVEKISSCDNLQALAPVLVRGAIDYRTKVGGILSQLLTKGSKAWRRSWFAPSFWAAYRKKKSMTSLVRELGPGIFAFPMFTARFALQLASELRRFRQWTSNLMLPRVSKNKYITVLDELRAETYFDSHFLRRFVTPIVAEFLPLEYEEGVDDRAYAFIRYYNARDAKSQYTDAVHHDESTVTLNVPLSPPRSFVGGNLSFCGMFGVEDYRKHVFTLDWSAFPPGYAVIHAGLRRHAASSVAWGERMNLVVWGISATPKGVSAGRWETKETPDPECLSRLYDTDFKKHSRMLNHVSNEIGETM